MVTEEQLLKDLEEFKSTFKSYPDPQHYPIQFQYLVNLFNFYKNRRENYGTNLVKS